MLLVNRVKEGVYEVNFMWLPTFIGMNGRLKQEMEKELADHAVGMTPEEASEAVLEWLCRRLPIEGLRDYLDGLKFVKAKVERSDDAEEGRSSAGTATS